MTFPQDRRTKYVILPSLHDQLLETQDIYKYNWSIVILFWSCMLANYVDLRENQQNLYVLSQVTPIWPFWPLNVFNVPRNNFFTHNGMYKNVIDPGISVSFALKDIDIGGQIQYLMCTGPLSFKNLIVDNIYVNEIIRTT